MIGRIERDYADRHHQKTDRDRARVTQSALKKRAAKRSDYRTGELRGKKCSAVGVAEMEPCSEKRQNLSQKNSYKSHHEKSDVKKRDQNFS
jgi:hypothetical protein